MKKCYKIITFFFFLCLFCAFTWPPENYDMPRTLLDAATVEESLSGLKTSFGSIANIGLLILGIIISVTLIGTIFRQIFLHQVNKFDPLRPRSRPEPTKDSYVQIRERDMSSFFRRRHDNRYTRHDEERGGGTTL